MSNLMFPSSSRYRNPNIIEKIKYNSSRPRQRKLKHVYRLAILIYFEECVQCPVLNAFYVQCSLFTHPESETPQFAHHDLFDHRTSVATFSASALFSFVCLIYIFLNRFSRFNSILKILLRHVVAKSQHLEQKLNL